MRSVAAAVPGLCSHDSMITSVTTSSCRRALHHRRHSDLRLHAPCKRGRARPATVRQPPLLAGLSASSSNPAISKTSCRTVPTRRPAPEHRSTTERRRAWGLAARLRVLWWPSAGSARARVRRTTRLQAARRLPLRDEAAATPSTNPTRLGWKELAVSDRSLNVTRLRA